jgi:hypothetical protein
MPALIAASSAAVGTMNLRFISLDLSRIGPAQTDYSTHTGPVHENDTNDPIAERGISDQSKFAIGSPTIGDDQQRFPLERFCLAQRKTVVCEIRSVLPFVEFELKSIYCMYDKY